MSKTSNYSPSIARYSASRSSMSTRCPPLSQVGNGGRGGGGSPVAAAGGSTRRSPASTSADIVVPRRAASSRNRCMTESSMLRVVFIWETIPCRDRQPTRPPRVIAEQADGDRAMACIERIEACCRGFANSPERGL